jgi:hypothetical protein
MALWLLLFPVELHSSYGTFTTESAVLLLDQLAVLSVC